MAEHDANAETARKRSEYEESTRKRLAEEQKARDKAHVEQRDASSAVRPTPTQAECDLAASGVHVVDKEPDGSPPDPGVTSAQAASSSTRQVEAKKPATPRGDYQTRQTQPTS